MRLGYARVSTDDQHAENQIAKLKEAGCEQIFTDIASGGRWDRQQLQACLNKIGKGDVLVVWKLDRLTRSLSDLLRILERLQTAGAGFRSLTEAIDTTTPAGRLMMHMLGSFAQFEREMVRERTKIGLARARAQGKQLGGRSKLNPLQQKEALHMMNGGGEKTQAEVARIFNVNRSTICRLEKERRVIERK